MSQEEFNRLSDEEKKIAIFEAEKISERKDETSKSEIFRIDNFYVEVRTSIPHSRRRIIRPVDNQRNSTNIFN